MKGSLVQTTPLLSQSPSFKPKRQSQVKLTSPPREVARRGKIERAREEKRELEAALCEDVESIYLVLFLNGSEFEIEEVHKRSYSPRPAPSEITVAWPAHQPPTSSIYRSSGCAPGLQYNTKPKPSRRRSRRSKKPACLEPAPAFDEPAPAFVEPVPVPVGILVVYEGMSRFQAPLQLPRARSSLRRARSRLPRARSRLQPVTIPLQPVTIPLLQPLPSQSRHAPPRPLQTLLLAFQFLPTGPFSPPGFPPRIFWRGAIYPWVGNSWVGFRGRQSLPRLQTRLGRPRLLTRHCRPRPLTLHGRPWPLIRPGDLRVRPLLSLHLPEVFRAPTPPPGCSIWTILVFYHQTVTIYLKSITYKMHLVHQKHYI
ncbi:hypothetical protein DPX16_21329 [Anabarilius grahami]|uniref:Uncharacterized protein n=1 Tax=Anabarilius grahami TaxID=495550 RepID=A0A3N0XEK7_ANAGA|nr:hypothetical protein DPX16_21329 [Anabarilius grahami]